MLIVGLCLIAYSIPLAPFNDYDTFQEKYQELEASDSIDKSEQYFELRAQHLTPKFVLFDYGTTLVIVALSLLFVFKKKHLHIYISKIKIFFLGILALILLILSMYLHLFIDYGRESSPHWADSIGIPMFSIAYISRYLVFYLLINFIGLLKKPRKNMSLKKYILHNKIYSLWYLVQIMMILFLLTLSTYEGLFFTVLALLTWLAFFCSMFLDKSNDI